MANDLAQHNAVALADGPVSLPNDLGWSPRIGINRTGQGTYEITGSFASLKPGGTILTVYVDPTNGSNGNPGTAAAPFRSLIAAWTLNGAGYDTVEIVIVAGGLPANRTIYGDQASCPDSRNKNVILRASDGGRVVLACHGAQIGAAPAHYNAAPVWSLVSGTPGSDAIYSTPIATSASANAMPIDYSAAARASQPNGEALGPTKVASPGALAAPNTAFADVANGLMYFRPFDDRDMRGDRYVTKGSLQTNYGMTVSLSSQGFTDRTVYLSNITVIGGVMGIAGNNNSPANTAVYRESRATLVLADACECYGAANNAWQANGGYDVYMDRYAGGYCGADATNPHNSGASNTGDAARAPRVFGWNCKLRAFTGYSGDHTNNALTLHEDGVGVYVMGEYGYADGRVIGWVNNTRGVLFGPRVWPSSATDASGYRSMLSASNQAVMDVYEPTLVGPAPATPSYALRTGDGNAIMRLHGISAADITGAGYTIQPGSQIVEENDLSSGYPLAGPLRVGKAMCQRGATTRLRVLGVWNGAPVTASINASANGTVAVGTDARGTYVDVALTAAPGATTITLTHAPAGATATNWPVVLLLTPAPTGIAFDTFDTIADNAVLTGRVAPSGGTWTATANYRGSESRVFSSNAGALAGLPAAPASANYSVQAELTFRTRSSGAVYLRRASASNFYLGGYDAAAGAWVIGRNVAGTISVLATGTAYNPPADDVRTVRLTASGTTLTLFVNGAQVATATDTSFAAAGTAGLYSKDAGTAATGCHYDNFVIDG